MILSPISGYLLRESQARQQEARRARYGTGPVSQRGSLTDAYDTVSTRTPDVVFEFGNISRASEEQQLRYERILSGGATGLRAMSADALDVQMLAPHEKDKDGNTSAAWRVVVRQGGTELARGEITADTRVVRNPDGSVTLEEAEEGGTFEGTEGNDILIRMSDRQVNAGAGNDMVISLGGSGGVDGGDGDDTILGSVWGNAASGEGGMTLLSGGAGDDRIDLDNSLHVLLDGGEGDDTLGGTMAHAIVNAGLGDDRLKGEMHFAGIDAGDGNDSFKMDLVAYSQVNAGLGDDVVHGDFRRSAINGGLGDDTFGGRFRVSSVFGEEGRDTFTGLYERGNADGGQDGDTFAVNAAHTTVFTGGTGDDVMRAVTSFFATYDGGEGNDVLEVGRKRHVSKGGDLVPGGLSPTAWKVDGLPGAYYAEGDLAWNEVRGGEGDDNLNVYGAPGGRRGLDEPARVSGGRGRDLVAIYGAMQRMGQLYGEEEDGEIPVLLMPYV
ncbi:MAG: calcium-binding protein [Desulfovibrio sp.]|jgi:Ca2+-binding RTX toxin-like protein|nr:calcium-binding protein [Desulfovibrio sp.]